MYDREILVEQVRSLYRNATRSIPFNIAVPLILVLVLWPVTDPETLLPWFLSLVVVSLVRLWHVRSTLRRDAFACMPATLTRQFTIGSTATAAVWSAGFVTIGLSLPLVYLTLFLLVIGGIAAGATTSMGTLRAGYFLFLAALYMPVLLKLAVIGGPLAIPISVVVVMFAVMLALTHGVTYRIMESGIRDRIENEHLVKQLERANARLEGANAELGTRVDTDDLTGIGNRRFFEQRFAQEWQRAIRRNTCIACIMIDVDRFKQYNDHYGHAKGDECLKSIARALDANVERSTDIVARQGGEEFIVLLPDTSLEGARSVAQRIASAIADLAIPHEASRYTDHVSVSMGVACAVPGRGAGQGVLVEAADEALYAAKRNGRDQVIACEAQVAS